MFAYTESQKIEELIDPAAPKLERTGAPDRVHAQEASRIGGLILDAAFVFEAETPIRVCVGPTMPLRAVY